MPLTGLTILAVDDNEAHNYALSRTLEKLGAKVLRAYTGRQALAVAEEQPSLILMDANLPDLDGFEVCRRLRSSASTAHIPVVFVSATCQNGDAKTRAESVGANAYLFYPVDGDHLLSVIQGQIARSEASSAGK